MRIPAQPDTLIHPHARRALSAALLLAFMPHQSAQATPPSLATAPLVSATTTQVLPNLMFILDNSGSMYQDYTPDYLSERWGSPSSDDKNCRDSGDDDSGTAYASVSNSGTRVLDMCVVGDPPYMTAAINSQYYNPAVTYSPAVNADGSNKAAQTTFTAVQTDVYGIQKDTQLYTWQSTIDLTTQYPDRVWCTKNNPTTSELIDTSVCRKNSDYLYPNATYKYGRSDGGSPNQQVTETMLSKLLLVKGAPYYYQVTPSEYCKATDLKECTASTTPTGAYVVPAYSRWCKDIAMTDCQAIKIAGSYTYPRYVGDPGASIAATGKITINSASNPRTVSSIKVGSVEILGASVTGASKGDLATKIAAQINAYASVPEYTATVSGSVVTITSTLAAGAAGNGVISVTKSGTVSYSAVNLAGGVTGTAKPGYTFVRTDIVPATPTYPKASTRTDCAGSSCTYTEEMINFSNWYAYYRTRMQAMKTSVSKAFKPIDSRYRVGFITINNPAGNFLRVNDFLGTQKTNWYAKLFAAHSEGSTPLRSALSLVGRMYAGLKPSGANDDPVQYSCQQNFALLTTDGYWNTDSASDVKDLAGAAIGDMDGGSTPPPMYEGPTASSASLADVAKYYYDTDLRTTTCTGALGAGVDVCENNVFVSNTDNNIQQHMTTFTLGLGVDATIAYTTDYKTATSGDFYKLKNGLLNWPVPASDTQTAVDDLWHAAVNGQGTYFSAKDPAQLAAGLSEALQQINAKIGSAAAAATSTLTPVAGDNFVYFPSYTTVNWTGNLEARGVNTSNGTVSKNATWCVENIVAAPCPAPGAIHSTISGSTTTYQCVTPMALGDCLSPGVYNSATGSCEVDVPVACTGTMPTKVAASSDTRTIYTSKAGSLVNFDIANVPAAYFDATVLSAGLSQWSSLTTTQKTAAAGANLVNFLRGQNGFEDRSSNTADNRLYRKREATLGDILESQPIHAGEPYFQYKDAGYLDFKADKKTRAKSIYVGANDGMLHAFDATTGVERWAFVPSMVLPNMWRLADKNYATMHTNFVNGVTVVGDICVATDCTTATKADWRTILVGGLGGGGIGYYALDVTDPATPKLLWEFDASKDSNLGFSYGNPIITKMKDKSTGAEKWAVLLTTGHYHKKDAMTATVPASGDGKGRLFALDAKTGAKLLTVDTGAGTSTDPAGFSAISAWADSPLTNNLTTYVYGGDLLGNVWRFDINEPLAINQVMKFALLKDGSGTTQPVTTAPELAQIQKKRVIYVATGKYIETSDLTNTQKQTLYAIQDAEGTKFAVPLATATLTDPRNVSSMVKQTAANSGSKRTVTTNAVDYEVNRGWYVDFPDSGERANLNPKLVSGALLAPTIVPSNTVCAPGGYGWFNYFDYRTGSYVSGNTTIAEKQNSTVVGVNTIYVTNENGDKVPVIVIGTSDANMAGGGAKLTLNSGKFQAKRLLWREFIPDAK